MTCPKSHSEQVAEQRFKPWPSVGFVCGVKLNTTEHAEDSSECNL